MGNSYLNSLKEAAVSMKLDRLVHLPRNRMVFLLSCLVFAAITLAPASQGSSWDEQLEGTLPLPGLYVYEVAAPSTGVTSVACDTGEVALHMVDSDLAVKQGRVNRGNWDTAAGLTLHTRFRVLSGDGVMALQVNDGVANGRLQLGYSGGQLSIQKATPDLGQPGYIPLSLNSWVDLWVKISGGRYELYRYEYGQWSLYSVGAASVTGGIVFLGSQSAGGTGSMDVDFWRLKTTGGYAPGTAQAPSIVPAADRAVTAADSVVAAGSPTSVTVQSTEIGVLYQLRNSAGNVNVGSPQPGTGGSVTLYTAPLSETTTFNVLAISSTNPTVTSQLAAQVTVTVATPVGTIAEAKGRPDGDVIQLSGKVVSASLPSVYWIEEEDRSSGIRVESALAPAMGTRMVVTGALATTAGERRIVPVSETAGASAGKIAPVAMVGKALGGGPLGAHSQGVHGGSGPNNIGLLVRTWGRITAMGEGYYYIDDGSGIADGTDTLGTPNVGVRVLSDSGGRGLGEFVTVTGVCATFANGSSQVQRAIQPVAVGCTPPNAGLSVSVTDQAVCAGGSTMVTVAASEVGVTYKLRNSVGNVQIGAAIPGTGGMISLPTGSLSTGTTFNVLATNATTGCSAQLNSTVTVTVNPLPNVGLVVTAAASPINYGQSTNINVALSEQDCYYQLRKNADNTPVGSPVQGSGSTVGIPTGALTQTTTFNILATRVGTGCSVQLAQTVTVTVFPQGTVHSKIGVHSVIGPRDGFGDFLRTCSNAGKPLALVKCVDDFGAANEAKQVNAATLTIGRVNEINGYDLQGLDYLVNSMTPQQAAQWYFDQVKPKWLQNPWIDVWECCNEWSWHWAWQADFYIAMMDIAEAQGFRIGIWSCSGGNPPEGYWADIARACARAKAHGNHVLCLHEYAWDGLLKDFYQATGDDIVLRYRRLYNYLTPLNADCPLALTEVGENGGGGFVGVDPFVADFAWYDSQMRQDPYVIGCAAWTLGNWSGANFQAALPALGEYIATH